MKLRTMFLVAAMTVALTGVVLGAQGPASAHDHQIPRTVLMKGAKELQRGVKVVDSAWSYYVGGDYVTQTNVYAWGFPKEDRVAAGSKLRIRILKTQKPDTFNITAYPKAVLNNGYWEPSGEERLLRSSLKPVVQDGQTVAWDAVFYVNRPDRDYYLVSEGHWQDVEGPSGDDQWAHWSFHVKTRSSS
jgi:hypothetical protein